jgi:hypothetical protein
MKSEKLVCTREWCNEWYLHQQQQQQQQKMHHVGGRKRKKKQKNQLHVKFAREEGHEKKMLYVGV